MKLMNTILPLEDQVNRLFSTGLAVKRFTDLALDLSLLQPPAASMQFDTAQIEAIWRDMPYWAFVWSSGYALAKFILDNPALVAGKRIADFGAGSGLVALAALKAGAASAVAVDIDAHALIAAQLNAQRNGLVLSVSSELPPEAEVDMVVVGDVLYDPRNHGLAQVLFQRNNAVIWAESQAQTRLSHLSPVAHYQGETYPNIGGFDEHQDIHIYHHIPT